MKINSVKVSDWTFKNIKNLNWDDHLESFGNIEDALNSKLYTLCIKEGSHTWTLILTEVAGEGGPDSAPQKFLLSQKFRHLMRCK